MADRDAPTDSSDNIPGSSFPNPLRHPLGYLQRAMEIALPDTLARHANERDQTVDRHERETSQMDSRHDSDWKELDKRHESEISAAAGSKPSN